MKKLGISMILAISILTGAAQAQVNDPIDPLPVFPTVPLPAACYTTAGCDFSEFVMGIGTIYWECLEGHCWIQGYEPINNESDCVEEERSDCSDWYW